MASKNSISPALPKRVVIIGAGNLAWHLCAVFTQLKIRTIVANYRSSEKLSTISKTFGVEVCESVEVIPGNADLYCICVPDREIADIAGRLKIVNANAVVCHTSGATPLSVLKGLVADTAVFYPLQSFTAGDPTNWKGLPILIESRSKRTIDLLTGLAGAMGAAPVVCREEDRLRLHLAAVLVNNFSNSLFVAAAGLLKLNRADARFDLLKPLITKTAGKVQAQDPLLAQTGPAKRGDKKTMKKHLDLLGKNKKLKTLYKLMSDLVQEQQHG